MAVVAALSLSVMFLSVMFGASGLSAAPGERIEDGAKATAEALDPDARPRSSEPETHSPSSFESFAEETLRRLNESVSRLQSETEDAAQAFGESMTDSAARMDDAWADTFEKFESLQGEVRKTYKSLERRTSRAIAQFQQWLAGDQTRPRSPAPRPITPESIEGDGEAIAV
ncbi:hypothetical protein [Methyloligella solikamskensis]|uniref:Uncharacterized protein n=1 Tax=Methyloligella solikamskensis TaxID=1177756 RepID=A0ABW3JBR4_9HYPH